jgi:hypothetical protein
MKQRRANGGREDPHSYCLPPNFPRAWTLPAAHRIVQTPGMMVMLHEFNAAYREVYLDGRPLPVNPNPTWNGYSTGHWDGDTLVIDTNGIRDDLWLDIQGSPITESARVTERLKRLNFGVMQVEIAVNDPKAYTKAVVGHDRNGACRWTRRCSKRSAWTTSATRSSTNDARTSPRQFWSLDLVLGFGWDSAWAHHSQSEYDSRAKVDVEGTVTKLEWKSPPRLGLCGT